jgi:cystathionine gamma-synthase
MRRHPNLVRRTPWPEGRSRAVATPLQPSTVYAAADPDMLDGQYDGTVPGHVYAREGHPNGDVLAAMIDRLEGAEGGLVVGSGMAAVTAAVLGLCGRGDHVLGGAQLYGRSLRMLTTDLPRWGIDASLCDTTDAAAVAGAIRPETRMILVETVSNPTLRVADMEGIAALARERGVILAVDNTFATPAGYPTWERGADVVIHSVTKLLAGHSDATLGYVAARDPRHRTAIYDTAVTLGLTASPFDCWLAERGLYTFDMRLDRAEANARALADLLADHPAVARVIYPGRDDHPDAARAAALLQRPGNMVSFVLHGGRPEANALTRAAPGLAFAPTLGDIGTTLSHPASSSHRAQGEAARAAQGITEGFFRVSVGCEPMELLAADFAAGLDAARAA